MTHDETSDDTAPALRGKTVAITGKLATLDRAEAEAQLSARGAKVRGSLSANTDILFIGDNPGSKLAKARKLGIAILDEDALVRELARVEPPPEPLPEVETRPVAALAGKTIVVAGTLPRMTPVEAEAHILAAGAIPASAVSRTTDLLLLGADPDSKLDAARLLGVETINEDQFLRLIEDPRAPEPIELTGALADFLPRYREMLAELEAHPEVELLVNYVAPPVREADVRAVEAALGETLEPAILNFYRQCNGLQLMWATTDNDYPGTNPPRFNDYHRGDGAINVYPLEFVFIAADWEDIHYFDFMKDEADEDFAGRPYPLYDLSRSVRVFDDFHIYNMAGFVTIAAQRDPFRAPISIGDDHGACWTDARLTDFEGYMETLLATRGSIAARLRLLRAHAGHREQPLVLDRRYWAERASSLDAILAEVRTRAK